MGSGTTEARQITIGPQPGPQAALISCPCNEIFYGGSRGGGKSYGVLIDWICHQQRYSDKANGILFRRSYPELEDMMLKASGLFPSLGGKFYSSSKTWVFTSGARLKFRHLDRDSDADLYQGHEYNWMAQDEAGNWPSPAPLDKLRACLRSADGVKHRLILTGNPGGPGHNWLKKRYVDIGPPMELHRETGTDGSAWYKTFIPAKVYDNKILLKEDPGYIERLKQSGPPWLVRAWLEGDWDIVAGGALDDIWSRDVHVIQPFKIPDNWHVDRSFDWGSSAPFSVCWWAESNGEEVTLKSGDKKSFPRGTLFLIAEYYGWNGNPNEGCKMLAGDVAKKIIAYEKKIPIGGRVRPGPADNSIFTRDNGVCIADDMAKNGVKWTESNKAPGSRVQGLEQLRKLLTASTQQPMESPGLFIFNNCHQFIRTVPVLPRDERDNDDVDTKSEDHIYDAVRYKILRKKFVAGKSEIAGYY
jgi:hypothetical protein